MPNSNPPHSLEGSNKGLFFLLIIDYALWILFKNFNKHLHWGNVA